MTTSPGSLFSGKIAMYYAQSSDDKIDNDIMECNAWDLFNKFLYLVTGRDEEGKTGKHERQKKTAASKKPSIDRRNPFEVLNEDGK